MLVVVLMLVKNGTVHHGQLQQIQAHLDMMDRVVEIVLLDLFQVDMPKQVIVILKTQNYGMVVVGLQKNLCLKLKLEQVIHQREV